LRRVGRIEEGAAHIVERRSDRGGPWGREGFEDEREEGEDGEQRRREGREASAAATAITAAIAPPTGTALVARKFSISTKIARTTPSRKFPSWQANSKALKEVTPLSSGE
jgi:hypothetical protein